MKLSWQPYLSYAGLLAISLGMQLFHPEMFALFCTQLPIENYLNRGTQIELPLNAPVVPTERIK